VVARRELRSDVEIQLHFAGGLTTYGFGFPTRRQRIFIALAGPFAGLIAGLAVLALGLRLPSVRSSGIYDDALFVTLGWSALNLIPSWPLDGSVLLNEYLKRDELLHPISSVIALAGAVLSFELQQGHLLVFFAVLLIMNVLAIRSVSRVIQRWNRRIG